MKKVKNKLNEQESSLYNIKTVYKVQNNVINFFDDYSSTISEIKYKRIHGEGIKI